MTAPEELSSLLLRLESERSPLQRFCIAREYLDACDSQSVDKSTLKRLLADEDDLLRAETADFLIVSGGLSGEDIKCQLNREASEVVLPRLWLALALADPTEARHTLNGIELEGRSLYERAYLNAALYVALGSPLFLYDLCAIACSVDIPASHSAIDLLRIVAPDRPILLRELVEDLRRQKSDNAEKARVLLEKVDGENRTCF